MSDTVDYLHAYAVKAICKARRMPFGRSKRLQRAVGCIYLLNSSGPEFDRRLSPATYTFSTPMMPKGCTRSDFKKASITASGLDSR